MNGRHYAPDVVTAPHNPEFPHMIEPIITAGMQATSEAAGSGDAVTSISLLTYAWVFAISLLGGLVSFIQKVKAGQARAFNFMELLGELATSAFAGVLTFWLCKAGGLSELMTAAFVGICGHMGSRMIFKLEKLVERWVDSKAGLPAPPAPPAVPQ